MTSFRVVGIAISVFSLIGLAAPPAGAQALSADVSSCSSTVPSPSPGRVGNQLSGVISLSADDAWAAGGSSTPVGIPRSLQTVPLLMRWNGTAWHRINDGLAGPGVLSALTAVSPRDVWAVGHQGSNEAGTPLIEHWNGTAWAVIPSPVIDQGYLLGAAAASSNDVWAVGIRLGPVSYSLIEHWNGSRWRVIHSPNPGVYYNELDSVAVVSSRDVWAVGSSQSNETSAGILAHWDGSRWTLAPNPVTGQPNTILRGVAAQGAHGIWAVGQTRSADGSVVRTLIEHFNGHMWKVVRSASPTQQSRLNAVAVAGGIVWAVGLQNDGVTNKTLVERLDHGRFSLVVSPNSGSGDNDLEGVAASIDGSAWAVGSDQGAAKGESLVLGLC